MAKKKLQRFAEIDTFPNVLQPTYQEALIKGLSIKGRWNKDFFRNDNPIVLELGCGKGEYTIGLGKQTPTYNFIGIDYKGARLWGGAKQAVEQNLNNIGFIRTRVDYIANCFADNEVAEIWITFPDPQEQESRIKQRLTHPIFIDRYTKVLKTEGIIYLKTDNDIFFEYSLDIFQKLNHNIIFYTRDLYSEKLSESIDLHKIRSIQTFYETKFIAEGKNIKFLAVSMK